MLGHMYQISRDACGHEWFKKNTVSFGDGQRKYDVYECKHCEVAGRVYFEGSVVYVGHQYDRGTVITCSGEGEKKPTLMRRKKKPTLMRRKKTLKRRK